MKKLLLLVAGISLLLVGCSDANISLKENNTIFTVGNSSVTENQVFKLLSTGQVGSYAAISIATEYILDQEVPVTDEIKSAADESLAFYEEIYGESFLSSIQASGFKDRDDFYENNLIKSEQLTELTKKYVDTNFNSLVKTYLPRKVRILTFADEATALSAKAALESNTDISEIVQTYNSTSDGSESIITTSSDLDTGILSYILDASEPKISEPLAGATVESYFIVQIIETDPEAMRDEVIDELVKNQAVRTESDLYFFNQYGFKIYDRTLYDSMELNYSDYLK